MMVRYSMIVGLLLAVGGLTHCRRPDAAGSRASQQQAAPVKADAAAAGASGAPAPIISEASGDSPVRVLDPRADEILRAMSALLASTTNVALEAEETYDDLPDGQPRVLLSNLRRVAINRPSRFVADVEGDSLNRSVWFDGKTVATLDRTTLSYATIAAPSTIDGALDLLSEKYGIAVPLADLIYADPYKVLTETVSYSRYLGIHRAGGRPCHHLVFAQPTIEWQLWVDAGEHPVPRKLLITYVDRPGEPQYTATITKWTTPSSLPDALFAFEPPEGAMRVEQSSMAPHLPGGAR